ncbi:nucleotide sugar dehydrogenase [Verrucomicrobia bacterium]|nr:nucleotide sugar dehydrogenase [Verrucomicrobiota bacterium]MDC0219460.1 nucleotide sugar dehydrogenase [Verrucomicrobiota bacterium]
MKIGIIGLGYVGLPLVIQFVKSGAQVLGIDLDETKVNALNAGESYIKHIPSAELQVQRAAGKIEATTDYARVKELDAVLICVPTPLDDKREPDLTYVLNTARAIALHLPKGIVVVLESTTYPGTTEDELRPILETGSGLKAGADFHLAYSPEREDPGNLDSQVAKIPKVIGGYTPACLEKAKAIYSIAIETLVSVSSCRAAEATKLLENIFRCVNIALVNEMKIIYHELGIDIWEVIEAAKTKPFGFMPFYPGPGLGGHCIPIDPFYLSWKAKQHGREARFIELAGEVNTAMPGYVIERLTSALAEQEKQIKGSRVLIVGLAYKPNVEDDRESPSYVLMEKLEALGAVVDYHDPHVPVIRPSREYGHYAGRQSVPWTAEAMSRYDAALIATAHDAVGHSQLAEWIPYVVDTRNALPVKINCIRA